MSLFRKQFSNANVKGLGKSKQVKRRTVSHAALDPAHVAAPDAGPIRKIFLGNLAFVSQVTDAITQLLEGRMPGGLASLRGHAPNARALRPFGPRPIGYNGIYASAGRNEGRLFMKRIAGGTASPDQGSGARFQVPGSLP